MKKYQFLAGFVKHLRLDRNKKIDVFIIVFLVKRRFTKIFVLKSNYNNCNDDLIGFSFNYNDY